MAAFTKESAVNVIESMQTVIANETADVYFGQPKTHEVE